ncbi:MAG TPA: CBS domain-containing protein [Pyrinomonadaceae bacterium]|nr:CBS domain-containing protein [Pyrinomonadaceae bacterium]
MQVREIMTENPACCTTTTSLQETARMMVDCDCGAIPVVENMENKKPVGIITDRDITIRTIAAGKNPMQMVTGEVMTTDVVTVTPDTPVEELVEKMSGNQIRRVIVVDENGACCGMVAQADIALDTTAHKTAEVVEEVSKASGG